MLHPANVTAPFTVRNLLNLSEFHTSYKDAVPTDCLTHMTSIHHHTIPSKSDEGAAGLPGLHENNSSYLYADNTRLMFMKNEASQPQNVNLNTSTGQMLESAGSGE